MRWKQKEGFVSNNCTYPPPETGYAQLSCVYLGVGGNYMKKTIPILIYLLFSAVFLLMAAYRIKGYTAGLFFLNLVFFTIYFIKSIIGIFRNRKQNAGYYYYLIMSFTFPLIWLKWDFEYYHFYYHLIYVSFFTLFFFTLSRFNKINDVNIQLVVFLMLLNICMLIIDDYLIFKFWNNDKVAWSDEKITWSDYRQQVPENGYNLGAITTNGLQWKISKSSNTPRILVIGFMKPSESWVKTEFKTDSQLRHERLYVDICELHARVIRKIFYENSDGIEAKNISEIEEIIQNIISDKNEMNNLYMNDTEHGRNKVRQSEWEISIEKKLKELDEFKK